MNVELTIYTAQGALGFTVKSTGCGFKEKLIDAIDSGTVVLETSEGTQLILNALNVVAIEVSDESNPPT